MAAPGMTLEERERIKRQVYAEGGNFKFNAAPHEPSTTFQNVEQQLLIERLLNSESSDDFFRQPPFALSQHAAPSVRQACLDNPRISSARVTGMLSRALQTIDAAYKRAGRLVHPDKCRHPRATEAFQRLAHFRAAEVTRRDVQPLQRDKCEECGTAPAHASMLFVWCATRFRPALCHFLSPRSDHKSRLRSAGCGTRRCHACNFGLVDKSSGGRAGDRYCFTCVWLSEDLSLDGPTRAEMGQRSGGGMGGGGYED